MLQQLYNVDNYSSIILLLGDNVNTKGVSISSTTAIAPATSLASAPRTATSAPASTPPIITTAITPATISTALTSTADPSITSN